MLIFKKVLEILKSSLRHYAEGLIVAVVVALLLRAFVVSAYRVPTEAMVPALLPGDFIFSFKLPFVWSSAFGQDPAIERGDVIVFHCPKNTEYFCVKRVVALPGETLKIEGNRVKINSTEAVYKASTQKFKGISGAEYLNVSVETIEDQSNLVILPAEQAPIINDFVMTASPDEYLVLGDNRVASEDSRIWGGVTKSSIVGRGVMIWMSIDWTDPVLGGALPSVRWGRVFKPIP